MEAQTMDDVISDLRGRRERYRQPGDVRAEKRQRERGKMLARERVAALVDAGSFFEMGLLAHEPGIVKREVPEPAAPGDGVITGIGLINGFPVCIAADDATVFGGARGAVADDKINRLREISLTKGYPFVALLEGSAGRIQDTIGAVSAGMGQSFRHQLDLKGVVPTVAAIMGYCFGGPAFFAAMSDFVPIVRDTGFIAMSGPPVIRAGTGQKVTPEEIGGSELHSGQTGLVDYVADDELDCLMAIRRFLEFFREPIGKPTGAETLLVPELETIVPIRFREAYDMTKVLSVIFDDGEFFEVKERFGKNIITALARLDGRSVGVVASQPMFRAGMIEKPSARKVIEFVELCNRLQIPLVFIQDVPGFHVGKEVEESGQVRDAADLISAVMSAQVPKVTVILRKSYGLSYLALGGKPLGSDFVFAWPCAEIGLMGPGAAARTMSGKDGSVERIEELTATYAAQMSPYIAAGNALIDDVIEPAETRRVLAAALRLCVPRERM